MAYDQYFEFEDPRPPNLELSAERLSRRSNKMFQFTRWHYRQMKWEQFDCKTLLCCKDYIVGASSIESQILLNLTCLTEQCLLTCIKAMLARPNIALFRTPMSDEPISATVPIEFGDFVILRILHSLCTVQSPMLRVDWLSFVSPILSSR